MTDIRAISLFGKKKYAETFPSVPVLYEKDFFAKFNAYVLHLPLNEEMTWGGNLNIFEESVLRLLALGNFDAAALNHHLCLPMELVKFILRRLMEQGYISDSGTIAEAGRTYLGTRDSKPISRITPVFALARQDTGEILPVLFQREEVHNAFYENGALRYGSAGKETTIRGKLLSFDKGAKSKRQNILTQNEIRSFVRRYNRTADAPIRIPNNIHIESSSESPIFLHIKVILQEGNIEGVLTSAGNSYHSPNLLSYAQVISNDLVVQMKKDAVSYHEKDSNTTQSKSSGRYAKLSACLKKKEFSDGAAYNSIDEMHETYNREERSVRTLTAAVEWALAYHLREITVPESVLLCLKGQMPKANAQMLFAMAKNAGIPYVDSHPRLFSNVSYPRLVECLNGGEPSLDVVLPVAAGVSMRRGDSLLRAALDAVGKIEKNRQEAPKDGQEITTFAPMPEDGLAFIERLSSYGKAIRHGEGWNPKEGDTVERIHESVTAFAKTLLPAFRDGNKSEEYTRQKGSASQRRLNAEVSIMEDVGEEVYGGLQPKIRGLLLHVAKSQDEWSDVSLVDFMDNLSAILEKVLASRIDPKHTEKNIEIVLRRLGERNALPNGLSKVSPHYYQMAASGRGKPTLGANVLAWAGSLSEEELVSAIDAEMFVVADEVAGKRGHGAGALELDAEDVHKLRDRVLGIVKWLEERQQ